MGASHSLCSCLRVWTTLTFCMQGTPPGTKAEARLLVKIDWSVRSSSSPSWIVVLTLSLRRFILSFICLMYFSNVRVFIERGHLSNPP